MSSRRVQKAAAAIREAVSKSILFDLKDPRVKNVTVTFVEVAPDLRAAKIHVSVMGDDTKQNLAIHGLQNAAGFLQARLNDQIEARYTPRLSFVLDLGVKQSIEVSRILQEVLPKEPAVDGEPEENTNDEQT
jgi:ribosome-binding factor A